MILLATNQWIFPVRRNKICDNFRIILADKLSAIEIGQMIVMGLSRLVNEDNSCTLNDDTLVQILGDTDSNGHWIFAKKVCN